MPFYSVTALQVEAIFAVVSEFETFRLLGFYARGGSQSLKGHISELVKIFHVQNENTEVKFSQPFQTYLTASSDGSVPSSQFKPNR
jgi:hypothetical protein